MSCENLTQISVSPDSYAIIYTTTFGTIVSWDEPASKLLGWDESSMLGQSFTDTLISPPCRISLEKMLQQMHNAPATPGISRVTEVMALRNNGTGLPVELVIIPVRHRDTDMFYIHMRDLSARLEYEASLIASEEKYRQLLYNNPYPMWIFDVETLYFLEVNDAAVKKYGYTREEFLSMTARDIRPPEEIAKMERVLQANISNKTIRQDIWKHRKKNGEIITAEVNIFPINYLGKMCIQAQINDITEKVQLQRELAYQHKMKQKQLTEAIFKAEEKERIEIGKELHDNINQILVTAKLYLDVLMEEYSVDHELLKMSRENILKAIQEIRNLSKTFISPVVEERNLAKSIEELIESILVAKKMKIEFRLESLDEQELSYDHKIAIYRIIQEQLNNILKYAGASYVKIILTKINYKIELLIEDNGRGFDPSKPRNGIGLTNIISRAALYNGKVRIDSADGQGCRLNVVFNGREQLVS
jgi:PAS domain S-box-containing protein